jgi:hypothetical protein
VATTNKHGLSRTIPEGVKRKVRKDAGFGCVICGTGIYEYEHVDPEWFEATTHNPRFMTLLCGSCHSKKTRGIIGIDTIKEAMKNPKCKQQGFSNDWLDFGKKKPIVKLGNTVFHNTVSLISINFESIFSILPPDLKVPNSPYRLFGLFTDNDGNILLEIKDNEWFGNPDNWDIENIGRKMSIRKKQGDISLVLENIPGDKIIIHRVKMNYKGYTIDGDSKSVTISTPKKELINIDLGGEIYGIIALDVRGEQLFMHNMKIKNAKLTLGGNLVLSGNTLMDTCDIIGVDGGIIIG